MNALKSVQWTYLAIAIFVFCLAGVFFVSKIPEVTDADMAFQAEETHVGSGDKPFRKQYRLFHAAIAQWCYVGAQGAYVVLNSSQPTLLFTVATSPGHLCSANEIY